MSRPSKAWHAPSAARDGRSVDPVDDRPRVSALRDGAAGEVNPTVDEGRAGQSVGWRWHGRQSAPRVGPRVVRFVLIEQAARVGGVALAADDEQTAIARYTGDTSTRGRHRCP